jgi:hypothetical protein
MRNNNQGVYIAVPSTGSDINIVNGEGEVLHVIGLSGGLHKKSDFDVFIKHDHDVELSGGATFIEPAKRRIGVDRSKLQYETGANPDYKPTRATANEVAMRRTIEGLTNRLDTNDKRLAAAENIRTGKMKREREKIVEQEAKEAEELAEQKAAQDLAEKESKKEKPAKV